MRILFLFFCLIFCFVLDGQNPPEELQEAAAYSTLPDSFAGLPCFNPEDISIHKERLIGLRPVSLTRDWYFFMSAIFSLVIVLVYLSSRDVVRASFKSLINFQYHIQYSRTDKQNNLIVLVVYYLLFVIAFATVAHFVIHTFTSLKGSFIRIFLASFVFVVWDYVSFIFYAFFTSKSKIIDLIKSISISFTPLWALLGWLAMLFVLLTSHEVAQVSSLVAAIILGLLLLVKELRVLSVLWQEKMDILSFHFFAYLCTFKFLPLVILIRIALNWW
tara:strand:+ start:1629 stop:2450 length:822 start_codon:yes stop_codon:yes gene_type:complete